MEPTIAKIIGWTQETSAIGLLSTWSPMSRIVDMANVKDNQQLVTYL